MICAVEFCWNFVESDYFKSPTILLKGALTGENCVTQTNTLLPVEMNFVDLILWSTRGNMLENIFRKYLFHPPSYWGWLTAVTDLYGKKCPHPQPRSDRMQKHNDSQEHPRISYILNKPRVYSIDRDVTSPVPFWVICFFRGGRILQLTQVVPPATSS